MFNCSALTALAQVIKKYWWYSEVYNTANGWNGEVVGYRIHDGRVVILVDYIDHSEMYSFPENLEVC